MKQAPHFAATRRDGAFRAVCFVARLANGAYHWLRLASRIPSRKASVATVRDLFRDSLLLVVLERSDVRQCAVCECLPPGSETCDTARPTVMGCSLRARSANETMPTSRLSRLTTGSRRTWTCPMFRATSSSA